MEGSLIYRVADAIHRRLAETCDAGHDISFDVLLSAIGPYSKKHFSAKRPDLTINMHRLASNAGDGRLSETIMQTLQDTPFVESAERHGPYINFMVDDTAKSDEANRLATAKYPEQRSRVLYAGDIEIGESPSDIKIESTQACIDFFTMLGVPIHLAYGLKDDPLSVAKFIVRRKYGIYDTGSPPMRLIRMHTPRTEDGTPEEVLTAIQRTKSAVLDRYASYRVEILSAPGRAGARHIIERLVEENPIELSYNDQKTIIYHTSSGIPLVNYDGSISTTASKILALLDYIDAKRAGAVLMADTPKEERQILTSLMPSSTLHRYVYTDKANKQALNSFIHFREIDIIKPDTELSLMYEFAAAADGVFETGDFIHLRRFTDKMPSRNGLICSD